MEMETTVVIQAAAAPPLARSVSSLSTVEPRELEERARYFFQIVDASEALLLEEIDDLRARIYRKTPPRACDTRCEDYGGSRWQDIQVYLRERRLEQEAVTKLLTTACSHNARQAEGEIAAALADTIITMPDSFSNYHAQRFVQLGSSNNQLGRHVQALEAAIESLRERLDAMPENAAVSSNPHILAQTPQNAGTHPVSRAECECATQPSRNVQTQEDMVVPSRGVTLVTASTHRTLQPDSQRTSCHTFTRRKAPHLEQQINHPGTTQLQIQLTEARSERDGLTETNAALRGTIAALRETNNRLLHRLHVKDQHLRQCCARLNELWK